MKTTVLAIALLRALALVGSSASAVFAEHTKQAAARAARSG